MTDFTTVASDSGVQLAVYDFGGTGTPALLTHGAGFCAGVLSPLARHLTSRFHCYGLDLRAHGRSGRPLSGDFAWEGFGRDVLAAIDGVALGTPVGIGHSLGATALLVAESARPGTFSWMYCFEPPIVPAGLVRTEVIAELASRTRRRRSTFATRSDALEHFRHHGILTNCTPEVLQAFVDDALIPCGDGTLALALSPDDEATIYESVLNDGEIDFSAVTCPVALGIGSEHDSVARSFTKKAPGLLVRLLVEKFHDTGHLGPLEEPEKITQSVIRASEWAES